MRFSLSGDMENNLRELQQQQMSKEFNCKCFIMIYSLLSHFIQLFKCKGELDVWNFKMEEGRVCDPLNFIIASHKYDKID